VVNKKYCQQNIYKDKRAERGKVKMVKEVHEAQASQEEEEFEEVEYDDLFDEGLSSIAKD